MKKFQKLVVIILLIGVILFLSIGCNVTSTEKRKEKNQESSLPKQINIGILRIPNDETIAISQKIFDKYFTDKGIQCNFIVFDSGVDANKALASGSIDFATMGDTNAIVALSRGLDVEMIWIHEVLGDIEALAVKEGSNIHKIEDLVGKKIATPFSSTSHYSLLNALKTAGIEDKVELLDMETTDIVAAWKRGDIQAAYTWQPSLGELLKDGKVLISSRDLAKQGYITANVGLVRKQFAQQYPDLVASFIVCLAEGGNIYRENPQKGATIAAQELEISPKESLEQMKGSLWLTPEEQLSKKYFGTEDSTGGFARTMKDTADFLEKQGAIQNSPTQEEFNHFLNSSYIQEAIQILKASK